MADLILVASCLAYSTPALRENANPGPVVTATSERSSRSHPLLSIAELTTPSIFLSCSSLATVGIIPPALCVCGRV